MRIYFASVVDPRAKRACSALGVKNYLLGFALGKRAFDWNSDILENPECRVIVDSGAFSAWNNGKRIDVKKYADFAGCLRERAKCELIFVNLDVIPGRKGTRPIEYERDISAEKSFKNWEWLHKQGIRIMNVFHQHERFYWLDEFRKHSNHIGVSPANDVSVEGRDAWLRQVFQWIGCSVRTHALALRQDREIAEERKQSHNVTGKDRQTCNVRCGHCRSSRQNKFVRADWPNRIPSLCPSR